MSPNMRWALIVFGLLTLFGLALFFWTAIVAPILILFVLFIAITTALDL